MTPGMFRYLNAAEWKTRMPYPPDRLSWNSAHETTGCTQQGLAQRQGAGRFYCFAAD
jgi:hypothetical protein